MVALLIPPARNHWKKYLKDFNRTYKDIGWDDFLQEKQTLLSLRRGLVKVMMIITFISLTLLFFIFTPILLPFMVIYDKKKAQRENEYSKDIDTNLYFSWMGGAGTIICCDCSYKEDIVSFVHGFDDGGIANGVTGYQCQSCGKFHSLEDGEDGNNKQCDCGGKLERDKPIFCPECKSKKVQYSMRYIT